jgi:DNA-directed RNA polymerase specialized sigma24 family protein
MQMPQDLDSSGELPADLPSGPLVDFDPGDARRQRLLGSEEGLSLIRRVARKRGVPFQDLDDVVHETIAEALEADLPAADGEARAYIAGIARRVSARHLRGVATAAVPYWDEDGEERVGADAAVHAAPFEERDIARRIVEHGHARAPRWFPVFLKAKVLGESADEVARRLDRPAPTVRRAWSELHRDLGAYGRQIGVVTTLVLIATGVAGWRLSRRPADFTQMATYQVRRAQPPPPDAYDLRVRALRECAVDDWAACLADIDAAIAMNPAIGTPEMRALQKSAEYNMHRRDQGPEPPPLPEKSRPRWR